MPSGSPLRMGESAREIERDKKKRSVKNSRYMVCVALNHYPTNYGICLSKMKGAAAASATGKQETASSPPPPSSKKPLKRGMP